MKLIHIEARHTEVIRQIRVSEACELCEVDAAFFEALVAEGLFDALSHQTEADRFLQENEFGRLKKAARLHHDLGVNPPGIALVLELLGRLNR